MPLEKGMYDYLERGRFDIRCGQIQCKETVHNGSWFNHHGEKLGWGDLNDADITRIAAELQPGEIFVVVGERDSFWDLLELTPDRKGFKAAKGKSLEAPGRDFCREKCRWVITPHNVYRIATYSRERRDETLSTGQKVQVIMREDVRGIF